MISSINSDPKAKNHIAPPEKLSHLWLKVGKKEVKGFYAGDSYFSLSGHEVFPDAWRIRDYG